MGNCISGCWNQFKDLRMCYPFRTMGDSTKTLDLAIATPASAAYHATPSTSNFSGVEEQIERSKSHWSTLVDHSGDTDEEEVDFEVSNLQEFEALQSDPTYGGFFPNFSGDGKSTGVRYVDFGELVVGKKFAEGGQAELFEAQIKWNDPRDVEIDREHEREFVLKVFKKGTLLKHLKSQLPQGLLLHHVEIVKNSTSPTPKFLPRYASRVYHGILLKGGRFAFLMQKQHCDLRTLIECNHMTLRSDKDCGPFSKEEAEFIMYKVALGVAWLHNRDIVHRDLKASNVLVQEYKNIWPRWDCFVADYECSIGVVGTDFFRAPEILQVCKEQKVKEKPEVFSRAADVYSYGMTCYEILTKKLPFEDHPSRGSASELIGLVINQQVRPEIPEYVEDWTCELLDGCWQADPTKRPRIEEILETLSLNSELVRRFEVHVKEKYGENFRI